jgi:hypothetical protein
MTENNYIRCGLTSHQKNVLKLAAVYEPTFSMQLGILLFISPVLKPNKLPKLFSFLSKNIDKHPKIRADSEKRTWKQDRRYPKIRADSGHFSFYLI